MEIPQCNGIHIGGSTHRPFPQIDVQMLGGTVEACRSPRRKSVAILKGPGVLRLACLANASPWMFCRPNRTADTNSVNGFPVKRPCRLNHMVPLMAGRPGLLARPRPSGVASCCILQLLSNRVTEPQRNDLHEHTFSHPPPTPQKRPLGD